MRNAGPGEPGGNRLPLEQGGAVPAGGVNTATAPAHSLPGSRAARPRLRVVPGCSSAAAVRDRVQTARRRPPVPRGGGFRWERSVRSEPPLSRGGGA